MKRHTTPKEKEVFEYLNLLRASGTMNMNDSIPLVIGNFPLSRKEARELIALWRVNFNEHGDYETITEH